jgi:hypothetical protein
LTQCKTFLPCGISVPIGDRLALLNNITQATQVAQGVVLQEAADRRLIKQAHSTLIAASSPAQTAQEHESVGHGLLTKAWLDLVNASNFMINHTDLIQELGKRVTALMATHFPGASQTPQLRGQMNRMEEDFLAGWRDSR